jgi:hypothetical protein
MALLPPHRFQQQHGRPMHGPQLYAPNPNAWAAGQSAYSRATAGLTLVPQTPKSRHVVWLVFGFLFAVLALACEGVSVGMYVSPAKNAEPSSGIGVGVMGLFMFVAPAVLFLTLGYRALQRNRRFERLIALAASAVRLPMHSVATELGLPISDARSMLMEAIALGAVRGRMDLEDGVFISGNADERVQQTSKTCSRCGAQSQVVTAPGQAAICPHCRAAMWRTIAP